MVISDENATPSETDLKRKCPSSNGKDMLNTSRAAKVFGNLIEEDTNISGHSLCYSPSPLKENKTLGNLQKKAAPRTFTFDEDDVVKPVNVDKQSESKKMHLAKHGKKAIKARKGGHTQSKFNGATPGSPRRRDMVKKTRIAITKASESVNESLNAVRNAKIDHESERKLETVRLKEERLEEKLEAATFHAEAEKTKRELLQLRSKLTTKWAKSKAERQRAAQEERRKAVSKDIDFKSEVFRDHREKLKEAEDRRRRMSTEVKTKIFKERKAGEERMKLERIEEDIACMDERNLGSIAAREYKKLEAEKRRNSLAFRNSDGKRHRDLQDDMDAAQLQSEHESLELKWAGESDAENYNDEMAEKRRNSFAFRNAEGKWQRELQANMEADERSQEHHSFETKWAGERDADEYRKEIAEERRDSLAFRNAEGKCQRDLQAEMKADELQRDHESFELKWAGNRDADEYRKKIAEDRRDSLSFRNAEGKCQRDFQAEVNADECHRVHESYELKWAGERDADEYRKKVAKERRDSLALRNAEGKCLRDIQAEINADECQRAHESYELKCAGERDADEHRKQMREEQRKSFEFRNAEGKCQRDLQAEMEADERHRVHESYEEKWAGEKDADEYKKLTAEERRESCAFRNAEGKRQRDVQTEMEADERNREHESYELKWAGDSDAEDYKKKIAKERRESFAFRNAEGKRQRDLQAETDADDLQRVHESYTLKWAGENDARSHKQHMAKERRESFAFRCKEGARHRAVMDEIKALAREKEHEYLMLKWAGEQDVKEYLAGLEQERRDSLAFRNAEGKCYREIEEEESRQKVQEASEEEVLQAACHNDVENYKKECAERDRASLCFRRTEASIQHMEEEKKREQEYELDQQNRALDAAACDDVKKYLKSCKKRNRLSLATRAKEKRRHADWEKGQATKQREQRHRDTRDRAMDNMYVELAKEKEKACLALENVKYASCSFVTNPFAALLDNDATLGSTFWRRKGS